MLLKHGADVGKENRSGWTGEQGETICFSLPSRYPGMGTGTSMCIGMLNLVLQLPRGQLTRCYMHTAPVQ